MKNILKKIAVVFAFLFACISGWLYFGNSTAAAEKNSLKKTDAATLYKKNCASCHGGDGQAKSVRGKLTKAQNLADADWQSAVSDEHIFNAISSGRKKMPAFGKSLSESQIDSLVNYVRKLKR